jgi:hypothetical protein
VDAARATDIENDERREIRSDEENFVELSSGPTGGHYSDLRTTFI